MRKYHPTLCTLSENTPNLVPIKSSFHLNCLPFSRTTESHEQRASFSIEAIADVPQKAVTAKTIEAQIGVQAATFHSFDCENHDCHPAQQTNPELNANSQSTPVANHQQNTLTSQWVTTWREKSRKINTQLVLHGSPPHLDISVMRNPTTRTKSYS